MEIKHSRKLLVAAMAATMSTGAIAQQFNYNEPTRGFMHERGGIAENRKGSVDIASGNTAFYDGFSGGIRLGLPGSELVINQTNFAGEGPGLGDPDDPDFDPDMDFDMGDLGGTASDIFLKVGMAPLDLEGHTLNWNLYGGLSHNDPDGGDSSTNIGFGAAFTTEIENFILNFNPELLLDDTTDDRDTRLMLGLGAHYRLPDTAFGRFEPGFEYSIFSSDVIDDNVLAVGTRWLYNEHMTMDFLIVTNAGGTNVSVPGVVRLNVGF